jgi:hypothetical protein
MAKANRALERAVSTWNRPSNLGLHLTCAGILMLIVSLALNRLVPGEFTVRVDDWTGLALASGYVVFRWALYLGGALAIFLGCWRIVAIDS